MVLRVYDKNSIAKIFFCKFYDFLKLTCSGTFFRDVLNQNVDGIFSCDIISNACECFHPLATEEEKDIIRAN